MNNNNINNNSNIANYSNKINNNNFINNDNINNNIISNRINQAYKMDELGIKSNILLKNEVNELEYFLYRFFQFIEINSNKAKILNYDINDELNIDKNGKKIDIYYYDIIKSEAYVDLNLQIEEIIHDIFKQMFCPYTNKRKELFNYEKIFDLEFEGINLLELEKKPGVELGLDEANELILKLNPKLYNDISAFPKDTAINLTINKIHFANFIPKKGGLDKSFLTIFNRANFWYSQLNKRIHPGGCIDLITQGDLC